MDIENVETLQDKLVAQTLEAHPCTRNEACTNRPYSVVVTLSWTELLHLVALQVAYGCPARPEVFRDLLLAEWQREELKHLEEDKEAWLQSVDQALRQSIAAEGRGRRRAS